ncbi:MAG: hypothetical protein KatS3mg115_2620 [Candidatus Poribacteria bacterium]|nr:MAG: hypothetical protein KatS3mg115_2620 [Candidatus Poribacteria bacterium]
MILQMVAEGRITPEQGDRLLAALEGQPEPIDYSQRAGEFVSRAAQDLRQRLEKLGIRPEEVREELRKTGEELRKAQQELRRQLRQLLESERPSRRQQSRDPKDHAIVIEVEEVQEKEPQTSSFHQEAKP